METLKYSEILKKNGILANKVKQKFPVRIKILSNIACYQLKTILEFNLRQARLNPEILIGQYDNIIQDSYNIADIEIAIIHYDLLNVFDKYSEFIEDFTEEQISKLSLTIKSEIDLIILNLTHIPTVVFNTFISEGFYSNAIKPSIAKTIANDLNIYLYSKKETNLQILDINCIVAQIGLASALDFRLFFLSKTLYTITFWKEYVYTFSSIVYKSTGKLKKAIIFDCDNTLWKGILGEDGKEGIDMSPQSRIGQIYYKIQQIAVWLSKQGVIIGLCSKNNSADVLKLLSEHIDVRLTLEHISINRINWNDKASNLREIAQELNIGLDSLVFIDDSLFEINLIKEQVPEIITLHVPSCIEEYPHQLLKLVERHFYLSGNLDDINKTKQYKEQSLRSIELLKHPTLIDYLSSIEIEIIVNVNDLSQVTRISQLTQKTNQFNLTTKRYTESQIEKFMNSDKHNIFSIQVKDKFGDSGLTAVVITNEHHNVISIDSFIMSCRIMGRNIEQAIMNHIISFYKQKKFKKVESDYFPTIKNIPVSNFYEESGFKLIKQTEGHKQYQIEISDYKPYDVEYIKIKPNHG